MKVDNKPLERLANNPARIDKTSEGERKEILEFLRKETDRGIEEERKAMDYSTRLNGILIHYLKKTGNDSIWI